MRSSILLSSTLRASAALIATALRPVIFCCVLCIVVVSGCSRPEPDPIGEVARTEVLERGKLLVHGLAACGFCHGAPVKSTAAAQPGARLTGGRAIFDSYGEVTASNITQLSEELGGWEGHDLLWLMRSGTRPDGSKLSVEVHRGYEWMSDKDLIAIVSYLRSLKGEGSVQERREIGFIDRNTTGIWQSQPEVRGYVPTIGPNFPLQYGKYLADNVARCASCHNLPGGVLTDTAYLGGGAEIRFGDESKIAPGITNAADVGLGTWSETDIVRYLRTGSTPTGRATDSSFCPTKYFALATDAELKSIAKYLKSVQ